MNKLKYLIIIVIAVFFLIGGAKITEEKHETPSLDSISLETKKEVKENDMYFVEIKGAVVSPGVYEVEDGSRVFDLIQKAGGLTKEGTTEFVNLSKKTEDEMMVKIYTKNEIKNSEKVKIIEKIIEKEIPCECPENDACIDDSNSTKINIKTASLEDFITLPGIGEGKAEDIIDYRDKNGFNELEDIMKISGIGPATYEKLKIYLEI